MANVSYDTLTIQINADSKQAVANISKLNRGLTNLDNTAKNLNTRRISEIKGLLLNIAKIDFSNVSKGLQDVVSAFKYFQSKTAQKVAPIINPKDFDKQIKSYQNVLGKDYNFSFLGGGNTTDSELGNVDNKAKSLLETIKELNLNTSQTQIILQALGFSVNALEEEKFKEIEEALKKAGVSGEKIKDILNEIGKDGEKGGKKASGGIKQLALQFKNILKYRVVRKVIQEIFNEISNAMSELASVDEGFNQSLGEIKSAFSYIGRVLTSIIAPIIKVIAPLITMVAQGIGEVGSALGNTLAGALGQEEFAEAQENVESYTESLNKAKSVSAGFDKLNVISQDKGSGNFEMTQTNETNNKLIETIKNLMESIKPIFTALKSFVEKIKPLLDVVIDIFTQILNETMGSVNESVANFIELFGTILNIIGKLLQALSPIVKFVITFSDTGLNIINDLMSVVFILVNGILQPLYPIIELIGEQLKIIAPILDFISETLKALTGRSDNTGARVVSGILTGGLSELIRAIRGGGYATGGFPEDGLFFANHTELVGQFSNGRTAVANNQQITQGIYQAVLQAMREGGGSNIVIQVDGREIAKVVNKENANMGSRFLMGGNINYGK